jgi:hypothetical protein
MSSDEDKIYIKIVALDRIYNFVVEKFLNRNCLGLQILKFKIIKNLGCWHSVYESYSSQYNL